MTYNGTVRGGKVELPPDCVLPDGTQVRVETLSEAADPLDALLNDSVDAGVSDLASQHDHYAYGTPKRGS